MASVIVRNPGGMVHGDVLTTGLAAGPGRVASAHAGRWSVEWVGRGVTQCLGAQDSQDWRGVVDLHGSDETASLQMDVSELGTLGQSRGFVTITPETPNPGLVWATAPDGSEMRWIGALFDRVESTLCVDERRVYVTGYSNGAFLASAIACRYAARVAAVAPVAGIETARDCRPSRPVPVVAFHGTADTDALCSGGLGPSATGFLTPAQPQFVGPFLPRSPARGGLSVEGITAAWAHRNGSAGRAPVRRVASKVTLVSYRCPPGADVQL